MRTLLFKVVTLAAMCGLLLIVPAIVKMETTLMASDQEFTCSFSHMWGSRGEGPGQFKYDSPEDIAVAPTGLVYAFDTSLSRVQVFDAQGRFQFMWGSYGENDGQFSGRSHIAVDSKSQVYVTGSSGGNGKIQIFDAQGNFLRKWWTKGNNLGDIAVDGSGNVYLIMAHRGIQVYRNDGQLMLEWDIGRSYATSIAVAKDKIYVAQDCGNFPGCTEAQVLIYDAASGAPVGSWGIRGSGQGQFTFLLGIATFVDITGIPYIFTGDAGNQRVQVFDSGGQFLTMFGQEGQAPGEFAHDNGDMELAVDVNGNVYVSDMDNTRIQVFSCSGFPAMS